MAASLPSFIAQTTSDAPLTISPAAKIPGIFVSIDFKLILIVPHFEISRSGCWKSLGIFSGLTLYAVQTKYDYTEMGGYLISCLLGFVLFGFMATFIHSSKISIIYSSAGSMLFSFYIVYDTQLIVGGNHRKIMFHTDDYVLAAVSLYLDVINLFLYLLDLISGGFPRD